MGALADSIKKLALGVVDESSPTSVFFGDVTSVNPLEITVEQRLKLTSQFLILTKNVKDYTVDVSMNWNTEKISLNANHSHTATSNITTDVTVNSSISPNTENQQITNNVTANSSGEIKISKKNIDLSHSHSIEGKKKLTIHNGLSVGDKVILLQQQGGNNYVVLDKI